jgi:hypothetical protein
MHYYPYLRILYLRELSHSTIEDDLIVRAAAVESNSEHFSLKQSSPQPGTVTYAPWARNALRLLLGTPSAQVIEI